MRVSKPGWEPWRFYRQEDLDEHGLEEYRSLRGGTLPAKIFPVCLHPHYGGWFGLRGILMFRAVQDSDGDLTRTSPPEVLQSQKQIAELLFLFNDHWRDRRYRDVGMQTTSLKRYSDIQQQYFAASTDERKAILRKHFEKSWQGTPDELTSNWTTDKKVKLKCDKSFENYDMYPTQRQCSIQSSLDNFLKEINLILISRQRWQIELGNL